MITGKIVKINYQNEWNEILTCSPYYKVDFKLRFWAACKDSEDFLFGQIRTSIVIAVMSKIEKDHLFKLGEQDSKTKYSINQDRSL